jgi:hypothetical protein
LAGHVDVEYSQVDGAFSHDSAQFGAAAGAGDGITLAQQIFLDRFTNDLFVVDDDNMKMSRHGPPPFSIRINGGGEGVSTPA